MQRIIDLSITRQKLEYTTRETSEQFKNIDRQIDAVKNVLLETLNQTIITRERNGDDCSIEKDRREELYEEMRDDIRKEIKKGGQVPHSNS